MTAAGSSREPECDRRHVLLTSSHLTPTKIWLSHLQNSRRSACSVRICNRHRYLQIISAFRCTMILRCYFFQSSSKCSANSLSWNILQITPLLGRFYSTTLPVTSRKQGISLQNTGGGGYHTMQHQLCRRNKPMHRRGA